MQDEHCMPTPWVSLWRNQLIPVNKAVNEKEQLEKGLEEEQKKTSSASGDQQADIIITVGLCKRRKTWQVTEPQFL
jgi:hypothetical protein